ncbi:MAG: hypothetical protein AB7W16_17230 [Candidatus Obscuribacterales bacterium]
MPGTPKGPAFRPLFRTIFILVGLFFSLDTPIWGADLFEQGKQFYSQGRYPEAWRCLKHVTNQVPSHWQAQYLLGNASLKLGLREQAKSAYEMCILAGPDPQTAAHCKTALDHLEAAGKSAETKEKLADAEESRRIYRDERELKDYSEKLQAAVKRREKILSEARDRASRIRREADEQIKREEEESQTVVRNPSTGEIYTGLPGYYVRQVRADAEARANRIIKEAEARAKGVAVPEAPTLHSEKYTKEGSSTEEGSEK